MQTLLPLKCDLPWFFHRLDSFTLQIGESLPPESSRLLYHLQHTLPDRLAKEIASGTHLLCTGNASAWASSDLEERHAIMNPFGHGFHLDRAAFDELLRSSVIDSKHSTNSLQRNACVVKCRFKGVQKDSANTWIIHADVDGKTMTFFTKWVIDATGRKASLASKVIHSCSP
jgi:flavin-dependent dehydrogenase